MHTAADNPDPRTLVFRDRVGRPLRRSNFRRRVWLPALVRAGLLGQVVDVGPHRYRAVYTHTPDDYAARILDAFTLPADDLLTPAAQREPA